MEILRRQIADATEDIVRSLLGIDMRAENRPLQAGEGEVLYHGYVDIKGAWSGRVIVACNAGFAQDIAAYMFRRPLGISDDDLHDALIEFANILGGNIKTLISECLVIGACTLSIPGRIDESEKLEVDQAICWVHYSYGGHRLGVELTGQDLPSASIDFDDSSFRQ